MWDVCVRVCVCVFVVFGGVGKIAWWELYP